MNQFFEEPDKIKGKKINHLSNRDLEGTVWFFNLGQGESLQLTISYKILKFFLFFFIFFTLIIVVRLFDLQFLKGDFYRRVAENNQFRIEVIKAGRGIIYDRQMIPLVRNVPKFSIFFIPQKLPKDEKEKKNILEKLGRITNQKIEELNKIVNQPFSSFSSPILIKDGLSDEEAILFEIEKENLPGFILVIRSGREYLGGDSLSFLLGYTGKISPQEKKVFLEKKYLYSDEIGKTGLEKVYEDILKGNDGRQKIDVDSEGKELIVKIEPAQSGQNLVLTIDLRLQKKLREILARQVKKTDTSAAGIILNPKNGEILALVSYPDFDHNLFSRGITQEDFQKIVNDLRKPFFFRAIAGEYQAGSTIKPLIALAGLEEKLINEKSIFLSQGGIKIGQWFFSDWKRGGHGQTNVVKALAESVNSFFYWLGGGFGKFSGLGIEKIISYLELFGLGQKTGIDLIGEQTGFIPSPKWKKKTFNKEWYLGDTYNLVIGQGEIKVTPLQVAIFTAAIANNGSLVKPILVKKIVNQRGQIEKETVPDIKFLNLSEDNLKLVKRGLREAVLNGTAKALKNLSFSVAGKTGTAETGKNKKPHAWFTSFAPAENPEIVITIFIENGGEGSVAAVPVAKEILTYYFQL